jgi:hypothetical protein
MSASNTRAALPSTFGKRLTIDPQVPGREKRTKCFASSLSLSQERLPGFYRYRRWPIAPPKAVPLIPVVSTSPTPAAPASFIRIPAPLRATVSLAYDISLVQGSFSGLSIALKRVMSFSAPCYGRGVECVTRSSRQHGINLKVTQLPNCGPEVSLPCSTAKTWQCRFAIHCRPSDVRSR